MRRQPWQIGLLAGALIAVLLIVVGVTFGASWAGSQDLWLLLAALPLSLLVQFLPGPAELVGGTRFVMFSMVVLTWAGLGAVLGWLWGQVWKRMKTAGSRFA